MRKIVLFLMFSVGGLMLFAQNKIIVGKVLDADKKPIYDAFICELLNPKIEYDYCSFTDKDGYFHIVPKDTINKRLIIYAANYQSVFIGMIDTIKHPLTIVLFKKINSSIYTPDIFFTPKSDWIISLSVKAEMAFFKFDEFKPVLGKHNIDFLNKNIANICFELGAAYKNIYGGFNFGFNRTKDYDFDSLEIKVNSNVYALNIGYNLIDSRKFWFTPEIALKWNRFRLMNADGNSPVNINQYMKEKELDLRFNQLSAYLGARITYKFYDNIMREPDSWSIGLYGGYLFKINEKPWLYSLNNTIDNNYKLDLNHLNFGISFSFNFN